MNVQPKVGIFLAKFNPLTLHHENTIESALEAGVFDKICVVPSDITAELFRTPVLDRSNMINKRYHGDERVITFLPHTMSTKGLPWIYAIVDKVRKAGYSPVGVFLWEDYSSPEKRRRLHGMVGGDEYLILYGDKEDGIENIPDKDPDTGEIRTYLSGSPELFENGNMFQKDTDELPLSDPVREYIYANRLYNSKMISGNLTDAFRNTFGTGIGKVLGRVPRADDDIKKDVEEKLEALGLN